MIILKQSERLWEVWACVQPDNSSHLVGAGQTQFLALANAHQLLFAQRALLQDLIHETAELAIKLAESAQSQPQITKN